MRKLLASMTFALVLLTVPASASAAVKISKISFDSPGSDNGSNSSLNAEWIQLHNTGSQGVKLTSWKIRDAAGHVYTFGTFTLYAGGYVKIHTGSGSNTHRDRYWGSGSYIWNNDGDTGKLVRPNGSVADSCRYSGAGSSVSC
jgi:Lamin Tail Domain